jgi:hypothetical protein
MHYAEGRLIKESEHFRKRYFAIRSKKAAKEKEGTSNEPEGTCDDPKLQRLLDILHGPMSVREMMAALGFGSRDKFLKNYLSPALKSGLVEMTDPNSPKSPKQRYRRTNCSSEN